MDRRMSDREVYPAIWVVLIGLMGAFVIWKYYLHEPTISACWIYQTWNIYCPGCGGTRALEALAKGHLLQSLWYHPAVLVVGSLTIVYMSSQTMWRLRRRSGWVLHYDPQWPNAVIWLLVINWVIKNLLLWYFGIKM